ncbi:hypothetical protein ACH4PW_04775 [Streptomyces sp. NPDC017082]|uniref:hypothetical protein n=1 Tax=Streptomyces sp. NPDC017082 TaxID=3364974 RepID=UPI0037BCDC6A
MIRSWGSDGGRAGRSRRAALLLGLVLVIAAHLTGAMHACSFAGSDPTPVLAQDVAYAADTTDGTGPTAPPRHRHAADGHSDHTADRPRAALDATGLGDGAHQPLSPDGTRGHPAHTGWRGPPGGAHSRAYRPAVPPVRVLRQ